MHALNCSTKKQFLSYHNLLLTTFTYSITCSIFHSFYYLKLFLFMYLCNKKKITRKCEKKIQLVNTLKLLNDYKYQLVI